MRALLLTLLTSLLSGTVVAAVMSAFLAKRNAQINEAIRLQYAELQRQANAKGEWKERCISEFLGPAFIQLDRTERAFARWRKKNVFLESKVIREGNVFLRDLILTKPHFVPPDLLDDVGTLVEHYDRWLEEFETVRSEHDSSPDTPFVFVGPQGYPFPREAALRIQARFRQYWAEVYGPNASKPLNQ